MFWFSIAILLILSLGWPLRAFWKQAQKKQVSGSGLNISIYRDRLEELKADMNSGTLEEAQFELAKAELARSLLQDLSAEEQRAARMDNPRLRLIITALIIIAVPLATYGLYRHLDNQIHFVEVPPAMDTAQAQQAYKFVGAYLFQLQQDATNADAWAQLGSAYMGIGRPTQAIQAFDRAIELDSDSPEVYIGKAHALGRLHRGDLSGEPARLIDHAFALAPENPEVLTWKGLFEFQRGEFSEAQRHWQKLLSLLPADAEQRPAIARLIAQAKQREQGIAATSPHGDMSAHQDKTPTPTTAGSSGGAASLKVRVQLDKNLKSNVKDSDTVFIYARASQGPPMPLAVVRKQVRDLPVEVTLDDSMAMSPQFKLSSVAEVKVFARVSPSGNAISQSGDLIGETAPVKGNREEPLSITINAKVP